MLRRITVGVLWTEVFEPGSLTFEALEQMLCRCCAAVFVVTPDDKSVIRERELRTPRANVLLEFGLVAGTLGRTSIALCRYGDAELPSDLKALTIVEMGPEEQAANPPIPQQAEKELRIWGARLIPTMETFPRTAIFQGHTGRWDFTLSLKVWRDLSIVEPSYAQIVGWVDLLISASGQEGRGAAHGRLFFKLMDVKMDIAPRQRAANPRR